MALMRVALWMLFLSFIILASFIILDIPYRSEAQVPSTPSSVLATTNNFAVIITTGLTYQQLLPAGQNRRSLTIQNNQISGTDVCYFIFGQNITSQITPGVTLTSTNLTIQGNTITAGAASMVLNPGQPYTRFYPYIPSDPMYVTCSTTGDSVYVDIQ